MKVRLFALCFLLSGCSVATPDPALVGLGDQALSDSKSADASYADVRATQAQALFDEIARLCGTTSDGATPEACRYPKAEPTVTPMAPMDATSGVLDALPSLDESSRPRVAAIYTQLAMMAGPVSATPPAAVDPAMLEWENAVVYGLDVALAFSGSATPMVEESLKRHQELVASLPASTTPAPAAYDLSQYPSVEATSDFLVAVEADSVSRWQSSALASDNDEWCRYALVEAGNAAVRYAALVSARGEDPMQAPFLKLS